MPFSLTHGVVRLLSDDLAELQQFEIFSLKLCSLDRYLNSTFLSIWFYMNVVSLLFRSILLNGSGLAFNIYQLTRSDFDKDFNIAINR